MKYILLTGHRKSGTTLLHKLFDSHPQLNVYPVDICLLYAFYPCQVKVEEDYEKRKERFSLVVRKSTRSMQGKMVSSNLKQFDVDNFLNLFWEKNVPEELERPSAIIEAMAECYCEYAELDTSLPFLFKETSQTVNFQNMIDEGLDVHLVQIIRDPRDNYAAIKEGVDHHYSKMGENEIESLASVLNRAKLDLELAWQEKLIGNKRFYSLRFEDLILDPEKEMRGVLNHLNLDWDLSVVEPTVLGEAFTGNNHEGKKFSGISAENLGRWRERISDFDAAVIEAWMKDVMTSWGYDLKYSNAYQKQVLSKFYAWYNCRYFYKDSFANF